MTRKDRIRRSVEGSKDLTDGMKVKFPDCPNCSLPMTREDNTKFSCPSCSGTFNEDGSEHIRKGSKPRGNWIVPTVISVIIVLMVVSLSIMTMIVRNTDMDSRISFVDIAHIRELPQDGREVRIISISREDYFEMMEERLDTETLGRWEVLFGSLLIIDGSVDLMSMEVDRTAEGPVCFYDTVSRDIYLVDDSESATFKDLNICAAYTHSLQDRNFNISEPGSFDVNLAYTTVMRADQLLTMTHWAENHLNVVDLLIVGLDDKMYDMWIREMTPLEYQNSVMGEISYFPYGDGYDFVEKHQEEAGWPGVDSFYRNKPPLSTEQILHYQKYLDYEPPLEVINGPVEGLDLRFETTVGEKLLIEMMPDLEDIGNSSGIGWGGDTFSYFEGDGEFLSVFKTVWDTEEQCEYFHDELVGYVEGKGFFGSVGDLVNGEDHITISRYGRNTTMYLSQQRDLVNAAMEG